MWKAWRWGDIGVKVWGYGTEGCSENLHGPGVSTKQQYIQCTTFRPKQTFHYCVTARWQAAAPIHGKAVVHVHHQLWQLHANSTQHAACLVILQSRISGKEHNWALIWKMSQRQTVGSSFEHHQWVSAARMLQDPWRRTQKAVMAAVGLVPPSWPLWKLWCRQRAEGTAHALTCYFPAIARFQSRKLVASPWVHKRVMLSLGRTHVTVILLCWEEMENKTPFSWNDPHSSYLLSIHGMWAPHQL